MIKNIENLLKKKETIPFLLLIILFFVLHFYQLDKQEFIGDEASPMLSIDRMWDAVPLKDIRFLAYPFLFYIDPFRAIFSGTLLHFFGPNRIVERLPSIVFSFLTICTFFWIFSKERIASWISFAAVLAYIASALTMNDRSGGGDAQTRFLFLLTGYLIWKDMTTPTLSQFRFSLLTWTVGMFTMLDTIALFPGIFVTFIKNQLLWNKKIYLMLIGIGILFGCYFLLWIILPYLTYKYGYQQYYSNRGLFYYVSRVGEGSAQDPFSSIRWLANFTSILFAIWMIVTFTGAFFIKKYLYLQIVSVPAWFFVIFLNRSSFHIIMLVGFFLFQAVLVTDYLIKKYKLLQLPVALLLAGIIAINAFHLYDIYILPLSTVTRPVPVNQNGVTLRAECLDESVVRIYKKHAASESQGYCARYGQEIKHPIHSVLLD